MFTGKREKERESISRVPPERLGRGTGLGAQSQDSEIMT